METEAFRGEYGFLSNFYPCEIEYDGITYPTSENAYQACKTTDNDIRLHISKLTAGESKAYSRTMDVREDWDNVKVKCMIDILNIKFKNEKMKNMLISTKGIDLVENNTWGDTFWGVCNGQGKNTLGKILMDIRKKILLSKSIEY